MSKEERILKYINTADELVFSGKRYYENDFYNDVENLVKENQELKKQLEEKNPFKGIFAQVSDDTLLRNCGNMNAEINELKNQQKEFIEWLENGINQVRNTEFLDERIQRAGLVAYNRVLSKYKEIIGG